MEAKSSNRLVMCCECRNKFPKTELIQYSKSKRMCSSCYDTVGKEKYYYNLLKDFICKARGLEVPNPFDLKQISDLKKEGYTSQMIGSTLNYMLSLKGIKMEKFTISNVRWYYQEYCEYDQRQREIIKRKMEQDMNPTIKKAEASDRIIDKVVGRHKGRLSKTRWTDLSKLEVGNE